MKRITTHIGQKMELKIQKVKAYFNLKALFILTMLHSLFTQTIRISQSQSERVIRAGEISNQE